MKKPLAIAAALMILLAVLAASPAFAQTDKEILAIANPILDKLTKGMETKDYALYTGPWTPQTKQMMTKVKFNEVCSETTKSVGQLESRSFYKIGDFRGYTAVQWKAKFTRVPQELYIWLFLKKVDNKFMVEGHQIKTSPLPE